MDDTLERAVTYFSDTLREFPDTNKVELIEEIAQKFDLDPLQTEFLMNKFVFNK